MVFSNMFDGQVPLCFVTWSLHFPTKKKTYSHHGQLAFHFFTGQLVNLLSYPPVFFPDQRTVLRLQKLEVSACRLCMWGMRFSSAPMRSKGTPKVNLHSAPRYGNRSIKTMEKNRWISQWNQSRYGLVSLIGTKYLKWLHSGSLEGCVYILLYIYIIYICIL